ncbi:hypothetical protein AKJ16_DCAP01344 [Drosera capensis]
MERLSSAALVQSEKCMSAGMVFTILRLPTNAHLKAIKLRDGQHSLQYGLHLHANSLAMTQKHENKTCSSSMVEGLRTSRHQKYEVDNPVMNSSTYTCITL